MLHDTGLLLIKSCISFLKMGGRLIGTLSIKFFEYLKIRVFEYLADNESFILEYSNTRILKTFSDTIISLWARYTHKPFS